MVYFTTYSKYVYALNVETGDELWHLDSGLGVASTPVVVDGVVYFGTDWSIIFGVDTASGEEVWRYETESGAMSFMTADESIIYAFFEGGDVIALLPRIERENE